MATPDRPPSEAGEQQRGHGEGVRSLRERIAATRWRQWLATRRPVHLTYRLGVGLVGALIVVVGLITIPLPGPGWLTVILGLVVLATEFVWAERLLQFTRRHVTRWTDWVNGRSLWVRLLIGLVTLAFVYGVVVICLHLTGLPSWVPSWIPLWR